MAVRTDEQTIRELAYQLWENRGRIDGYAEEDWYEAERIVLNLNPAAPGVSVNDSAEPVGGSYSDDYEKVSEGSEPDDTRIVGRAARRRKLDAAGD